MTSRYCETFHTLSSQLHILSALQSKCCKMRQGDRYLDIAQTDYLEFVC